MNFSKFLGLIIIFLFVAFVILSAQNTPQEEKKLGWNNAAVGNLNFTQSSFDNWTQGGENSWSWLFKFNAKIINEQNKYLWENNTKFEYGQSRVGLDESKKSADEIFLETKISYKSGWIVNPYLALNGRTQFADGFDYSTDPKTKISRFLNPGYFIQSLGFEYKLEKKFSSRLGFAAKQTVVTDEMFAPLYTDDINTTEIEKIRHEIGLESVTEYYAKISQNILYATNLELFSNMKRFNEIDVRWDNLFSAEVSKYIVVSFNFQIFYDRDINVKRQFKQVLAVGLTYTFL